MRIRLRLGPKSSVSAQPQIAVAEPVSGLDQGTAAGIEPAPRRTVEGSKPELRLRPQSSVHLAPIIKTFTASSIAQAMLLARAELGDEAILIQSKTAHTERGSVVQYEVTFGLVPDALVRDNVNTSPVPPKLERPREALPPAVEARHPLPPAPVAAAAAKENAEPASSSALSSDRRGLARAAKALASVRSELNDLHAMLGGERGDASTAANLKRLDVYSMLVQQDVGRDLALEISSAVEHRLKGERALTGEMVRAALAEVLAARVRCGYSLAGTSKPVVLAGPPASGKTTVLMKLALESGVRNGRHLEVLTLDRRKAGPNKTLETMVEILGGTYRSVTSGSALRAELQRQRPDGGLLLVEAPSLTENDVTDKELVSAIQSPLDLDVHLVLSAAWHPASIRKAVDRYEAVQPSYLLFTMLDQAASLGAVLTEAVRTAKPLSYFGTGGFGSKILEPSSMRAWLDRMLAASPAQ